MRALFCTAITLTTLVTTSSSARAVAERLCSNEKIIAFNDLSMIDGSKNNAICKKRYGVVFETKIPSASNTNPLQRCTHNGHDILVISIDDTVEDGIFFVRNSYSLVFPWDKSKTPVGFKLLATGLVGSREASGVFSDGTCRGTLTITQAPKTRPQ